jgi:hypothetical protein
MPEAGEIDSDFAGHAHQYHAAARLGDAQARLDRLAVAHRVDGCVSAAGEIVANDMAAHFAAHRALQLVGGHHDVGAKAACQCLLMRVAGTHQDLHAGHVATEAGDRAQTHRAGAEHCHNRILDANECRPAQQCAMNAARSRLDHYRGFVAHLVGHMMQLALVGKKRGAPPAAG